MITVNQAIEHAANHDELDEKLKELFRISAERKLACIQAETEKAYMQANAEYIARCDSTISVIANILTESTSYLESQKLCLAS